MTCICKDRDITALSQARGICKEEALLDFLAYLYKDFVFCSDNQSFYKKLKDGMSVLIATPGRNGFEIDPYVSIIFEIVEEKVNVYFDGNHKAETFSCGSDELAAAMNYYKIALDFQRGKLVGFVLDF